MGQIIRQVVQVPRKVDRLAWLTSQAPAYGEQLPWYHKPPSPLDPPPHPDQRGSQARAWAFSPMPAYAESVVWRHPQPQPPDPPPLPDQRGQQAQAWAYSPMPGYAETLAWWHKPPPPADLPVEIVPSKKPIVGSWVAAPAPIPTFLPILWQSLQRVPPDAAVDYVPSPRPKVATFAGGSAPPASDKLPWRRVLVYNDPSPAALPSNGRSSVGWKPTLPHGPPIAPPSHAGIDKSFVDRVPDAPARQRRHNDKVAAMLNSLLRKGILYSTGIGEWNIDTTTAGGAGLTGTFYQGEF